MQVVSRFVEPGWAAIDLIDVKPLIIDLMHAASEPILTRIEHLLLLASSLIPTSYLMCLSLCREMTGSRLGQRPPAT